VKNWIDRTIKLNDSWGPGAAAVLGVPLGCAAEFSLRARYLRDTRGTRQPGQLRAEISSGYLSDGWHDAIFTPVGTVPIKGIFGLPPWDPSQADTYRKLIDGPNNNLGDPGTLRLEGSIGYVDPNGAVGYYTARLFYAFNAVEGAPCPDLVIIKLKNLVPIPGVVKPLELDDGGGQGPPG
jgi:hypothetical protein